VTAEEISVTTMFNLINVALIGTIPLVQPFVLRSRRTKCLSSSTFKNSKLEEVYVIDEDVIAENIDMHAKAVRESEGLFYGFYGPDGIDEWDYAKSHSGWTHYRLCSGENGGRDPPMSVASISRSSSASRPSPASGAELWESFLQLDTRIAPPPFTTNDMARVSLDPILSFEECEEIIDECENHYWGWGSSRERYGTPAERVGYMLKLEDLSRSYSLVNFELLPRLFPAIASAFPSIQLQPENLRLGGCRVVKYDASEGRVELGMHRDGLLVTANIALNSAREYEGGGTIVEGATPFDEPIRVERGHVLLHPGDVRHGGAPITAGKRYVLVCFILDATVVPHEKYCYDQMDRDVEAARTIPADDLARASERNRLFERAAKNCADAYAFCRLQYGMADYDKGDAAILRPSEGLRGGPISL